MKKKLSLLLTFLILCTFIPNISGAEEETTGIQSTYQNITLFSSGSGSQGDPIR